MIREPSEVFSRNLLERVGQVDVVLPNTGQRNFVRSLLMETDRDAGVIIMIHKATALQLAEDNNGWLMSEDNAAAVRSAIRDLCGDTAAGVGAAATAQQLIDALIALDSCPFSSVAELSNADLTIKIVTIHEGGRDLDWSDENFKTVHDDLGISIPASTAMLNARLANLVPAARSRLCQSPREILHQLGIPQTFNRIAQLAGGTTDLIPVIEAAQKASEAIQPPDYVTPANGASSSAARSLQQGTSASERIAIHTQLKTPVEKMFLCGSRPCGPSMVSSAQLEELVDMFDLSQSATNDLNDKRPP